MICNNCGRRNRNTNIRCEFCRTQLINTETYIHRKLATESALTENQINSLKKASGCINKVLLLIFLGPFLLVGILMLSVSLSSMASEKNQIKNYETTTGVLKNYVNCWYQDEDELCEAIYEYKVNGVIYTASLNASRNREAFKNEEVVYYNPNNPQESVIRAGLGANIFFGALFIVVVVFVFIRLIKNNVNKKANIKYQ